MISRPEPPATIGTSAVQQPRKVRSWQLRAARVVTEVFTPVVLVTVCVSLIATHSANSRSQALVWAMIATSLCSFTPLAYILRGIRHGRWADHHVTDRGRRRAPLIVCFVGCTVAVLLGIFGGAPRDLIAVIAAGAAALVVAYPCTMLLRFKISIHSIVAFGSLTVLAIVISPWVLTSAPLPVAIGWSRVRLREHTPAQVIAGAFLGTVTGIVMLWLLR